MAIKRDLVFTIEVDSSDAVKFMKMMNKQMLGMSKTSKKAAKGVDDLDDAVEDLNDDVKKMSMLARMTGVHFNKLNSMNKKVTASFEKIGMAVISINQGLDLMQRASSMVIRPFAEMATVSRNFGQSIAEINTLLTDNEIATAGVTKQVKDLFVQFGQDSTTAAKAYYQAISSGAATAFDATTALTAAGKLAIGGITDMENAVNGLTTLLNAYELTAEDSSRVTDAFFIAMKKGKTTVGELARSISNVTPIASSLGVELEEVLATVSAITTDGTLTAEAVTQLRSALTGLSKQTPQLTKVLNDLGVASIKTAIEDDGLVKLLNDIIGQTDGSTEALTELFGRIEAVNGILTLTGNAADNFSETMEEMARAAENTGAVTDRAFKTIAERDKFRSEVAFKSLERSMITLGDFINRVFVPVLEVTARSVEAVVGGIDKFTSLDADIIALTVAIGGLTTALTFFNTTLSMGALAKIGPMIMAALPAIKALTAAISVVAIKFVAIGAAVTGVVATIDILARNWKLWAAFAERALLKLRLGFEKLNLGMQEYAQKVQKFFGNDTLGRAILENKNVVSELESEIRIASKSIDDMIDNFDFGFAGQAIDMLTEDTKQLTKANEDLARSNEDVAETGGMVRAMTKEQQTALLALRQQTSTLKGVLEQFGKTELELIEQSTANELKKIDFVQEQLKLKGEITDAARAELDLQRQLTKEISEQQKIKMAESQGAFAGPAKQLQGMGNTLEVAGEQLGFDMMSVLGEGLASVGLEMAASMASSVLGVILMIPDLLNAVSGIFDSITSLPTDLANAINGIFDSLISFVADFIPNLINAVESIIDGVINFIFDLPDVFTNMITEVVPNMLSSLIERLPEMVRNLAMGLVKFGPQIAISMTKHLIKIAPVITMELIKSMPEIAKALVNGIIDGIIAIGDSFLDLFGMGGFEDNLKDIGDGIEGFAADLAKSTQDAFAVMDLEEINAADRVGEILKTAAKQATDWLALWWDKFVSWIKMAFAWVDEKILQPFLELLKKAWSWIDEKILQPFLELFKKAWSWVDEKILQPLLTVGKKIWEGFVNAAGDITKFFSNLGNDIWNGLKEGIKGLGKIFQDIFDKLNPANLLQKMFQFDGGGRGTVEKALGIDVPWVSFASGGVVGGHSPFSGDNLKNDIVPAMLSPGEVVVPRSALERPGVAELIAAVMGGKDVMSLAGGTLGKIVEAVTGSNPWDDVLNWVMKGIAKAIGLNFSGGGSGSGGGGSTRDPAERMSRKREASNFSNGGAIPGFGTADTVNNIGQPGEFVMNHVGRATLGDQVLNAANKGVNINQSSNGNQNSGNVYNLNVNVHNANMADERKLASNIMEQIKRDSVRGKWVIDTRGLRTS